MNKEKINELINEIEMLREHAACLDHENKELKITIAKLVFHYDGFTESLEKHNEELKERVKILEDEITKLNIDLFRNEAEKSFRNMLENNMTIGGNNKLNSESDKIKNQAQEINHLSAALEKEKKYRTEERERWTEKKNQLGKQIEIFQAKIRVLSGENARIKEENEKLKKDAEYHKKRYVYAFEKLGVHEEQWIELCNEKEALELENAKLSAKIRILTFFKEKWRKSAVEAIEKNKDFAKELESVKEENEHLSKQKVMLRNDDLSRQIKNLKAKLDAQIKCNRLMAEEQRKAHDKIQKIEKLSRALAKEKCKRCEGKGRIFIETIFSNFTGCAGHIFKTCQICNGTGMIENKE